MYKNFYNQFNLLQKSANDSNYCKVIQLAFFYEVCLTLMENLKNFNKNYWDYHIGEEGMRTQSLLATTLKKSFLIAASC